MTFPFMGTLSAAALSAGFAGAPLTSALLFGWLACILVSAALPKPVVEPPPTKADYEAHGLGPLDPDAPPAQLYLDLMKRVVLNICFHEQSYQVVLARSAQEGRPTPELATRFSLRARVLGEDGAVHTSYRRRLRREEIVATPISLPSTPLTTSQSPTPPPPPIGADEPVGVQGGIALTRFREPPHSRHVLAPLWFEL